MFTARAWYALNPYVIQKRFFSIGFIIAAHSAAPNKKKMYQHYLCFILSVDSQAIEWVNEAINTRHLNKLFPYDY